MFVEHLNSFGNSVSGLSNTGISVELEDDTLLMRFETRHNSDSAVIVEIRGVDSDGLKRLSDLFLRASQSIAA